MAAATSAIRVGGPDRRQHAKRRCTRLVVALLAGEIALNVPGMPPALNQVVTLPLMVCLLGLASTALNSRKLFAVHGLMCIVVAAAVGHLWALGELDAERLVGVLRVFLAAPTLFLTGIVLSDQARSVRCRPFVVAGAVGSTVLLTFGQNPINHISSGRIVATGLIATWYGTGSWVRPALLAFQTLACLVSGSRSAILMPLLAWSIVYVARHRGVLRVRAVLVVALLAAALVSAAPILVVGAVNLADGLGGESSQLLQRQLSLKDSSLVEGQSAQERTDIAYARSIEMIGERPVVGWGVGAPIVGRDLVLPYPHNMALELGVTFGVVGVALAVILYAWIVRLVLACARSGAADLAALLMAWFLFCQVSGSLGINRSLWLFVGLAAGHVHQHIGPRNSAVERHHRDAEPSMVCSTIRHGRLAS